MIQPQRETLGLGNALQQLSALSLKFTTANGVGRLAQHGDVHAAKLFRGLRALRAGSRLKTIEKMCGSEIVETVRAEILGEPGVAVVSEVKCSQTLYDDIAKHGGKPVMWKTGHSLIKAKMKEEHAAIAGEMSGHFFFAHRYLGYDDAIYAAVRLLEIVARATTPLSTLLSDVPVTYTTPELRVDCPDEHKFAVVKRVTEKYRATHEVIDIDGARILFEGGWGLVRASNTGPVLVLRFEANTAERLAELRAEVEGSVQAARKAVAGK